MLLLPAYKSKVIKLHISHLKLKKFNQAERDYLRAKANKTGSRILRQAYSQVRARVNQKLYNLYKTYYTNKIEKHEYDLKNTWKVLKGVIGKTIGIKKINCEDHEITDKKKQATEKCNEYFCLYW